MPSFPIHMILMVISMLWVEKVVREGGLRMLRVLVTMDPTDPMHKLPVPI